MNKSYFEDLYTFQDRALKVISAVETDFYLTGGSAASRGYLNHRFSNDLELFVNDDNHFDLWVGRIIQALTKLPAWKCVINQKEERFARLTLAQANLALKIEMVNDVPARVGQVSIHPVLGRLDSAGNILANKVTALLDREEPRTWQISGAFAVNWAYH